MHENRRYVKLSCFGLCFASALLCAPAAGAELLTSARAPAALAVGRDGAPRVAYAAGCALHVAVRASAGWQDQTAARCLPLAPNAIDVDGIVVDPHGSSSVLVQDETGGVILLARQTAAGWRLGVVARVETAGSTLGRSGLTLDAQGSPVVAYAVRNARRATFLRLVRVARGGRLVTTRITRGGFPPSLVPPAAAPVLVRGRIHVVEVFGSEGIEWEPVGRAWSGQYLFANIDGINSGPVFATAVGGATWTASTLLEPRFGESDVLVTLRNETEDTSTVFTHAQLSALTLAGGRPEVAANEEVDVSDWADEAALVSDTDGNGTELDGTIEGYATSNGGIRNVLLQTERGLEWFGSPTLPSLHVKLEADASGRLSGTVSGVDEGRVDLYRERPDASPVLLATPSLGAGGVFAASDAAPTAPTLYRAVYRDPATGLPYASLTTRPVG